MTERRRVRRWMRDVVDDYVDPSNIVNTTQLAEAAADEFEIYVGEEYDIPEWVFELAAEAGADPRFNQ